MNAVAPPRISFAVVDPPFRLFRSLESVTEEAMSNQSRRVVISSNSASTANGKTARSDDRPDATQCDRTSPKCHALRIQAFGSVCGVSRFPRLVWPIPPGVTEG